MLLGEKIDILMKIAQLTKYGSLAASARQRFYQYQPFLEDEGFNIFKQPLFNNEYLQNFYSTNNRDIFRIAKCYLDRIQYLLSKPDVDLIWLHCELLPYLPSLFEKIVKLPKKPIIYDFDDAIFHNYDLNPKWYVKKILGSKLHTSINAAKIAFCGNEYLANYARPLCSNIKIVPTTVNSDILRPISDTDSIKKPMKIGWIGTPTTYKQYIHSKIPLLKSFTELNNCKISIMGSGESRGQFHQSIEFLDWSESKEVQFIQSLDIGIMPLDNSPWSNGKSGYKIIQYMSCGIPVVASPVGVNKKIIENGISGFLAETDEDWHESINILLNNQNLRQRMGASGRIKVEKEYSLKVWGPKISKIIREVLEDDIKK